MNWFISGGCKNGKSHYAQNIAWDMAGKPSGAAVTSGAAAEKSLYYLATMIPRDEEDEARIARHIRERAGMGFETIERGLDIVGCLGGRTVSGKETDQSGVFLLDSVTALLSNEMFREDGTTDMDAPYRVAEELTDFARLTGNTVFVSDYIYSDAMIYDDLVEAYRRGLALIDRTLAMACDHVAEVAYGFVKLHK